MSVGSWYFLTSEHLPKPLTKAQKSFMYVCFFWNFEGTVCWNWKTCEWARSIVNITHNKKVNSSCSDYVDVRQGMHKGVVLASHHSHCEKRPTVNKASVVQTVVCTATFLSNSHAKRRNSRSCDKSNVKQNQNTWPECLNHVFVNVTTVVRVFSNEHVVHRNHRSNIHLNNDWYHLVVTHSNNR